MVSNLFIACLVIGVLPVLSQQYDPLVDIKAENFSTAKWQEVIVSGDAIYLKFFTRDQHVDECPVCLCYLSSNTSIPPFQKGEFGIKEYLFFVNCSESEEIIVHWSNDENCITASLSDQKPKFFLPQNNYGYKSVEIGIKLRKDALLSKEVKYTNVSHALPKIEETINPVTNATVSIIQMKLVQKSDKCKNFIEFQKNAELLPSPPSVVTVPVEVLKTQTVTVAVNVEVADSSFATSRTWIIVLCGLGSWILLTILYVFILHISFNRYCCFSSVDDVFVVEKKVKTKKAKKSKKQKKSAPSVTKS